MLFHLPLLDIQVNGFSFISVRRQQLFPLGWLPNYLMPVGSSLSDHGGRKGRLSRQRMV